jgi:hypothetical protein
MTTNQKAIHETHLVEFEYDGHACLRFFDPSGGLCVFGPDEARESLSRYVAKYEPHCRDQSLKRILAAIRPETDMNKKLHAILHLLEEHKEDIAQGIGIGPDLVMKVLDSFGEWHAIEYASWTSVAACWALNRSLLGEGR